MTCLIGNENPQVILASTFYQFILNMLYNKNNERPDWMTDLKHTDSAWFSKVTQVNSIESWYLQISNLALAEEKILLSELKVKMLLYFLDTIIF